MTSLRLVDHNTLHLRRNSGLGPPFLEALAERLGMFGSGIQKQQEMAL